MKNIILTTTLIIILTAGYREMKAQADPEKWAPESTEWYYPIPANVKPGNERQPPSDAIILFDGKDLSKWQSEKGGEANWIISNGILTVNPGKGGIVTKEYFGDCQLHLEFKVPKYTQKRDAQNRGNSGVILQGMYEIQILDGDNNETYVNGMVGSIYKQYAPAVNAYSTSDDWQVYDIYYVAPKFGTNGELEAPAIVTVVLNGVLIQNNKILKGNTPWQGPPMYKPHGRMPLRLQDHGEQVAFRNIWIRNL